MKFLKNLLAAFIGSLIAFGFLMLLTFGIIGGLVGGLMSSSEPVTVYPNSVLKIDLSSAIGEQTVSEPLDFSTIVPYSGSTSSLGILDAVKSIDHAAQDPDIKFIYLTNCAYSSGLAYMEELRGALERFRASGKPVIAYGQNFSLGGYYLASVADKIYSDEFASNNILGVSTTIFFLKDILDRFGVEMQLIRHGKYKSAGEQFIADNISEANREQNQAMVDALWQTVRDGICRSRGITPDALDRMVNNLELNTAEHMLNAGLIDGVYTVNEMEDQLRMLSGAEKIKDVKMITLDKYAKARLKTDYKVKDKIAVIYADGQINVEGDGITAQKFQPIIRDIRSDSTIKAVVLRVNSPGGAVQPAEIIRTELELLQQEKPLIVSYGTMAASGGYWISAGADKIYSNNSTLTGVRSHSHADMYSPSRRLDSRETEATQEQIEMIYDKFITIVSDGRGISKDRVDEIAQGRVWCGNEALGINLVNEIGGLTEALDYAAASAGLESYRVVSYPAVQTSLDKLMENISTTSETVEAMSEPETLIEKIYGSIKAEAGIYALLPYVYLFE